MTKSLAARMRDSLRTDKCAHCRQPIVGDNFKVHWKHASSNAGVAYTHRDKPECGAEVEALRDHLGWIYPD
jgi:hypothetical protein